MVFELAEREQEIFLGLMAAGNYTRREVPYAIASFVGEKFNVTLYEKEKHGKRKLCVQGAGEKDFVEFVLEPNGVLPITMGGLGVEGCGLSVEGSGDVAPLPHGGSDESGKGDYFGPLVVACTFMDEALAEELRHIEVEYYDARNVKHVDKGGVRDCKLISNNTVLLRMGEKIRAILGPERYAIVKFGSAAYNRCYAKFKNINRMLAWAHGTCIEELLEKQPTCPLIVVDQFARTEDVIKRALKARGKKVKLDQRHKAEAYSIAVAASSVLARETFLRTLCDIAREIDPNVANPLSAVPIGSSDPRIREIAAKMVRERGPNWLMNHCKAHFRTTDQVLEACGLDRTALPEEGRIVSASFKQDS